MEGRNMTLKKFDPEIAQFFDNCDEIWHAGDIGSEDVLDELEKLNPVRAVWGRCILLKHEK